MKMRVLAACLAAATLMGGLATAQTIRTPAGQAQMQNPNLTVAPASAADVAALQTRLTQLEAAHNTTRTELAQARLQLTATQNQLTATQNQLSGTQSRLNAVRTILLNYSGCKTNPALAPGSSHAPVNCDFGLMAQLQAAW